MKAFVRFGPGDPPTMTAVAATGRTFTQKTTRQSERRGPPAFLVTAMENQRRIEAPCACQLLGRFEIQAKFSRMSDRAARTWSSVSCWLRLESITRNRFGDALTSSK